MATFNSLYDLETLFIEKLQEKYKLNIRDIKKAFSSFDTDRNGLLDLRELVRGIQQFLNGVKESQVQELVSQYDANGDGKISYEEFLSFLQNRSAVDQYDEEGGEEPASASSDYYGSDNYYGSGNGRGSSERGGRQLQQQDYPPRRRQGGGEREERRGNQRESRYYEEDDRYTASDYGDQYSDVPSSGISHEYVIKQSTLRQQAAAQQQNKQRSQQQQQQQQRPGSSSSAAASEVRSDLNLNNPKELEYRAKIFISSLKSYLSKKAHDMRLTGSFFSLSLSLSL
jgi:hypothetical protein